MVTSQKLGLLTRGTLPLTPMFRSNTRIHSSYEESSHGCNSRFPSGKSHEIDQAWFNPTSGGLAIQKFSASSTLNDCTQESWHCVCSHQRKRKGQASTELRVHSLPDETKVTGAKDAGTQCWVRRQLRTNATSNRRHRRRPRAAKHRKQSAAHHSK